MPTRSNHSNMKVVQHVAAQNISTTNTPSSGVDTEGADALEMVLSVGTIANIGNSPTPSWAFKLQESDESDSDFSDVTDSTKVVVSSAQSPVTTPDETSGVFLTIDDAANDAATYRIAYIGDKRYVRLVATAADTPGDTPYSVNAVLTYPHIAPTKDGS